LKESILRIFIIAFFLAAALGFAEDSPLSRLAFSISSQPEPAGSTTNARLSYDFGESLSSAIYFNRRIAATTGELALGTDSKGNPAASSSLNLERTDSTEIFVLPIEYRLAGLMSDGLTPDGLTLGAGLYASLSNVRDVGFFALNEGGDYTGLDRTNSYDSSSSGQFYGPVLTLETGIEAGFLSIKPRIVIVPIFYFSESLGMAIGPLLASAGRGSVSYASSGFPYLSLAASGSFFRFVGFDLSWEMSSSAARMISAPDTTHASWWGKPVSLTTSSTKALVSIVIPLSGGALRLGGGPAIRSTDTGDGRPLTETTPVFIVGYSFFRD
jgi:hypothetical protein